MKKKMIPTIIYAINLIMLSSPWITIGEDGYNVFQFIYIMLTEGAVKFAREAGLDGMDLTPFELGLHVQMIAFVIFVSGSVAYVISIWRGKRRRINYLNMAMSMIALTLEWAGTGLYSFCQNLLVTGSVMFSLLILTLLEWPVSTLLEHWDEAMIESKEYDLQYKAWKQEVKERLEFKGNYSKSFYRIVWKNFKSNWNDYVLLLFCNAIVFGFMIVGFGVQRILAVENSDKGIGIFSGLNTILANTMIPMGIISVFIIILLLFYYLKCRARNYGVFLTLGMRRKTLYYFVAIEFISGLLMALSLGAVLGTGILVVFVNHSYELLGIAIDFSVIGFKPYLKAVFFIVLICIVSMMIARDIVIDFNVGQAADLRAIGEKIPKRFRKIILVVGALICTYCIIQYSKLYNFENVYLILGLFVGLFLLLRYGLSQYLLCERKHKSYLKKLLLHNQLFHKSMTNTGYIMAFTIIHFCVLFYFAFQMISAMIAEDAETLYPYDIVCLAQENDTDFIKEIKQKYDVKMWEYPAVRVSAYDSTEEMESFEKPFQGQHIGISESTYHALKKNLNPSYEESDLGLDAKGDYIHIVYQQDKSVKAQPTDFYLSRKKPLLHVGQPCRLVDVVGIARGRDVGYKYYKIKSEEIGSLTGVFRQGLRENIIVFSDEYFDVVRETWKTTHIYFGTQLMEEVERIEGVTINQGITKLVLINVAEKDMGNLLSDMRKFEERHLEEEAQIYNWFTVQGVYDLSAGYHYEKPEAVANLHTERIMKITMNALVMLLFLIMNILLIVIKVLSEKEQNQKHVDFLECMGMREKDIRRLLGKKLLRYYHFLPFIIAASFALIFTLIVFHARMYTSVDIQNYLQYMIPVWMGYGLVTTIIATCISWSNIYHLRTN